MKPPLAHGTLGVTVKWKISRRMNKTEYINDLISTADGRCYPDFCRLLVVMWWNI